MPSRPRISRLSFRLKLLLAMSAVVAGGGLTTLVITQRQVQATFERLYEQQFRRQIEYFSALQDARLAASRELSLKLARSEAIVTALNRPEPDTARLYAVVNAALNEAGEPRRVGERGPASVIPRRDGVAFCRFVNAQGKALLPPETAGARRFTPALQARLDAQAPQIAAAIAAPAVQQVAYLSAEAEVNEFGLRTPPPLRSRSVNRNAATDERTPGFQEVLVTEILAPDTGAILGALVLGLPMPELVPPAAAGERNGHEVRAAMLQHGHLYANPAEISELAGTQVAAALESRLSRGGAPRGEFNLVVEGLPHRVFYHLLNPDSFFPAAYQVSLFSLRQAEEQKAELRWRLAGTSLAVLLAAGTLGLLLAHQLAAPLRELTEGTRAIARGALQVRLRVRSRDELGRLTHAFNTMAEGLAQKEKYRHLLNLVADERVAQRLAQGGITLGGEQREVSVLFCDIRRFTAHTETMPPGEVIAMLNEHMSALTAVVRAHGGVIDKFVGDLLMAVFGAPLPGPHDADSAARCGLALIAARAELNRTSRHSLDIGIGIATGPVVAGCMGSPERLNYTVIGERVNLASRLCDLAPGGEVLLDETTRLRLGPAATCEPQGALRLKGFSDPQPIFRLAGLTTPTSTPPA